MPMNIQMLRETVAYVLLLIQHDLLVLNSQVKQQYGASMELQRKHYQSIFTVLSLAVINPGVLYYTKCCVGEYGLEM